MSISQSADAEKAVPAPAVHPLAPSPSDDAEPDLHVPPFLQRLNTRIESLAGFEARGITRVLPAERQAPSRAADLQVAILWFSANISVNNLTVGLFGPLVFRLGFVDSALCAVFGGLLGSMSTGYMSIWGPASGNRTMVVLRYFMGYWPSKIPTALNIVLMGGYITVSFIICGQMLSAVSGGSMTIVVGIIVAALVSWIIAVFGMAIFHHYERYACIPQILALFVLIGCAGPYFNGSLQSTSDPGLLSANRLSFFTFCLYVPNSWGAAASDFYVYYPENTSRLKIFLLTTTGLWTSFTLVYLLGIGLASGIATRPAWEEAYAISVGALVAAGFDGLGGFGGVCAVIIALGIIANSVPGVYSAALGFQVLGRYGKAVPRYVWSCFVVLVTLICALAGRDHILVVFQNVLALMGYWMEFMVLIVVQEHLVFRRGKGFDWTRWEDKVYLPVGVAALVAFLAGWLGAVLGMSQVYYVGRLAELAGGSDIGLWVGCGFTILVFPPLRWLELKWLGK